MLEDRIYQDYVSALKAKDKHKAHFLSFIRAGLKNAAIELKKDKLDDDEALAVLKKQKKRLLDTKESIVKSQRSELLEDADKELVLLSAYLPEPLSQKELLEAIDAVIAETGASSTKDMGRVMREVLARVGSRAEAKEVSALVKEKLSSSG
jgi:hypothetical protein